MSENQGDGQRKKTIKPSEVQNTKKGSAFQQPTRKLNDSTTGNIGPKSPTKKK